MITKHGLEQVQKEYELAVNSEVKAREALDSASERLDVLREALECEHLELEDAGSYMFIHTRCKKCGFMWQD